MQQNQPSKQPSKEALEVAAKILVRRAKKLADQRKSNKPLSNLNERLTSYTADEIRQRQEALDK